MPLKISWSGLRTHETCKQQGYLARQGKKAPLADQRVFFAGNVTDRVVRNWLFDEPAQNIGRMPSMVADMIVEHAAKIKDEGGVMRWKDSNDRAQVEKDCIEAVTKIEPLLLKYVVPHSFDADFKFEAPLSLPHPKGGHETVLLIGFMDIIVQDAQGRWFVHDVKHTKDSSYWRKTIGQLGFYDLAVELLFGQPTTLNSLMQPLCAKQMIPYKPSPDSRAQLLQRITNMASDIWRGDNSPRQDTKECGWCAVKHACPKFAPTVQKDGSRRITLGRH